MQDNNKKSDIKNLETCILQWNVENPVDRWWRTKHKVAFNSTSHREVSFIDMYWEFYEDCLYLKALKKDKDKYVPGQNDFVQEQQNSNTISEEEFDNIEI